MQQLQQSMQVSALTQLIQIRFSQIQSMQQLQQSMQVSALTQLIQIRFSQISCNRSCNSCNRACNGLCPHPAYSDQV